MYGTIRATVTINDREFQILVVRDAGEDSVWRAAVLASLVPGMRVIWSEVPGRFDSPHEAMAAATGGVVRMVYDTKAIK